LCPVPKGAVGWAAASIMIGYFLDTSLGFGVLFISAPIGALLCVVVGYTYMYESPNPPHRRVGTCEEDTYEHSNLTEQEADQRIGLSSTDAELSYTGRHSQQNEVSRCRLTLVFFKAMIQTYSKIGFLASLIALNIGTSVVENLIFLYFENLGTSYTICGVSVLVTVVFEIPVFYFAPQILDRVGPEMMQKVACLAYIVRVLGYTFIPKDYGALVLLLEPLHGVTYGCAKTSSVHFAGQVSVEGYEASAQGVLSLVVGIGSMVGLLAGGLIEETFGPVVLYRSYAVVVALGLTLFYMGEKLDLRPNCAEIELAKSGKNPTAVKC